MKLTVEAVFTRKIDRGGSDGEFLSSVPSRSNSASEGSRRAWYQIQDSPSSRWRQTVYPDSFERINYFIVKDTRAKIFSEQERKILSRNVAYPGRIRRVLANRKILFWFFYLRSSFYTDYITTFFIEFFRKDLFAWFKWEFLRKPCESVFISVFIDFCVGSFIDKIVLGSTHSRYTYSECQSVCSPLNLLHFVHDW